MFDTDTVEIQLVCMLSMEFALANILYASIATSNFFDTYIQRSWNFLILKGKEEKCF